MSKINSTFNAGYYMDKSVDWAAFAKEQEQRAKQKEKERRERLVKIAERAAGENNKDAMDGLVLTGGRLRQTFAVPFHCQCLHCHKRIAKGTHVYMNRYKAQQEGEGKSSLGLTVWEIQFRCTSCSKHVYIRTDYDTPEETGGYIAYKHCKRFVGDFAELNRKQVAQAKEEAIAAAKLLATMSDAERRGLENKQRQEEDMKLEALIRKRNETSTEDLLARIARDARGEGLGVGGGEVGDEGLRDEGDFSAEKDRAVTGDMLHAVGLDAFAGDEESGYDVGDDGLFLGNELDDVIALGSEDDARSESDTEEDGVPQSGHGDGAQKRERAEGEEEESDTKVTKHRQIEEGEGEQKGGRGGGATVAAREENHPALSSSSLPPPTIRAPQHPPVNSFLASLGAVLGTNFNSGVTAAPPHTSKASASSCPSVNSAPSHSDPAPVEDDMISMLGSRSAAAPAKKKSAPKLKGKDFLNNYFNN